MAAVDELSIAVLCSGPGEQPLSSKTQVGVIKVTAANLAAQTTLYDNLTTAYITLTTGTVRNTILTHEVQPGSLDYPSVIANRGNKWIITAANAAGDIFTYTIPAADPGSDGLNADNITANLTGSVWSPFVTAFEAVAVDPAGAALTIVRAKLGGRRR